MESWASGMYIWREGGYLRPFAAIQRQVYMERWYEKHAQVC